MNVDVRGVNTHNKGAHLMLIAISNNLPHQLRISTSPNGSSYESRAALGLYQTVVLNQAPRLTGQASRAIPERAAQMFGLSRINDISAVIDASGFAYSDSFGPARAKKESSLVSAWNRRGVRRVFLPQAFGPFTDKDTARLTTSLLKDADVVYARDDISANFLNDIGLNGANIRRCSDFTVLETGIASANAPVGPYGCFVPNSKMVTHGGLTRHEYIADVKQLMLSMAALGLNPIVAPHESTDVKLANEIAADTSTAVYWNTDPLAIKGVLGGAEITVGSRFHALVGSLSLGRPTVGLGWSHKYAELFKDFGVSDWISKSVRESAELMQFLLMEKQDLTRLDESGSEVKQSVRAMWSEVARAIEGEMQ